MRENSVIVGVSKKNKTSEREEVKKRREKVGERKKTRGRRREIYLMEGKIERPKKYTKN